MTIHVLVDNLPENGYKRICEEYNLNRGDLPPIKKAGVYEGGFEVPIHFNEAEKKPNNYNERVRQLRWSRGKLLPMGHIPLQYNEQLILLNALKKIIGNDKVIWT